MPSPGPRPPCWAVLVLAAGCAGELGAAAVPGDGGGLAPDGGEPAADPFAPLVVGPLDVPAEGSAPIAFDVPEGTLSFTVIVEAPFESDTRRVVILGLENPAGERIVDWDDPAPDPSPAAIPYPGVTAALVPSTDDPRARPVAGAWSVRVGVLETDFVDFTPVPGRIDRVTVLFEPEGEEGGSLDLNVFFAPATGVSAGDAETSDFVEAMLAALGSNLLEPAGATLGDVGFADLPARWNTVESSAEVRELVSTLARPGRRGLAVNVFLVDSVAFAAGFTGGVPSPPGRFDTAASGVVIERFGGGGRTGVLLAHEVGHFLGLRHTTELGIDPDTGGYRVVGDDGVSDTPTCPSGTEVTRCPDYRNLMFPLFPVDGLSLTDAQAAVLSGSHCFWEE